MAVAETSVVILNRVGLHARPASMFVQKAAQFQAQISVRHGDKSANAKSILGILKLGAGCEATLDIRAEGVDAQEAIDALVELVNRKFGEEE